MSSLVRCRVRDLASCFHACRFSFEEEPEPNSQCSNKSTGLNSKRGVRGHGTRKKTSKTGEKGESVQSSSINNSSSSKRIGRVESSFADEDYIVFSFREDGAIQMIDECKSSSQTCNENIDPNNIATTTSHRPINKVHCDERVERSWDYRPEDEDETNEEKNPVSKAKQDDENGNEETETDEQIKEINQADEVDLEQSNAQKMESFESCDSNLSDTSTTSFAFPVLSIEWMGSPVHMPKSEDHHMCIHCCRF